MQTTRYLQCLAGDAARLRDVAGRDLTARVPTCPEWDVAELVRHTAAVYLHKVQGMQRGGEPGEWPPPGLNDEEPLGLFDRAYADLLAEFAARDPDDPTRTWYDPEQTVGFWIRRMAQETVIHRVDAELALNDPIAPIQADLAVDGVDEVLVCFLGFITTKWRSEFGQLFDDFDGRAVRVETGGHAWIVRLTTGGVEVSAESGDAVATVSGLPHDVLLWLWRRAGDETVTFDGDMSLVRKLHDLLGATTQ